MWPHLPALAYPALALFFLYRSSHSPLMQVTSTRTWRRQLTFHLGPAGATSWASGAGDPDLSYIRSTVPICATRNRWVLFGPLTPTASVAPRASRHGTGGQRRRVIA